jgi:hypothetical protein
LAGDIGTDAVQFQQCGVGRGDEGFDELVEFGDLGSELLVAAGQRAQCELGCGGRVGGARRIGAGGGADLDQLAVLQAAQVGA